MHDNVTRSYTQRYSASRWVRSQSGRGSGIGFRAMSDAPVHAPHGPLPDGGTVRPITRWGTPVMHRPQQPVTAYDDELRALVADMVATMYAADGVGLAACQIGVDLAVFVFDCPDESGAAHRRRGLQPGAHAARGPGPPARRRRRGLPVLPRRVRRVRRGRTTPRSPAPASTASRSRSPATGCWPAASSTRPTTRSAPSSATGCSTKARKKLQKEHDKAADDYPLDWPS